MTFMKGSDRLLKRRCTAIASRLCFNPQIGDEWVSMGGATLLADIVVDFSASVSDKVICACIFIHLHVYSTLSCTFEFVLLHIRLDA
jgi:hypothetical protein